MTDLQIVLAALHGVQKIMKQQIEPPGKTNDETINALHDLVDNSVVVDAMKRLGLDPTKE